jgi:hypothetical protein
VRSGTDEEERGGKKGAIEKSVKQKDREVGEGSRKGEK